MRKKIIEARTIIECAAVDLEQIAATLGLLLEPMYEDGGECPQRPALTLLWKNLLEVGSRMNQACDCFSALDMGGIT